MSLEGDLMLPPRGPMKWRWLSSIIEKISRAANLISARDSIIVATPEEEDTPYDLSMIEPNNNHVIITKAHPGLMLSTPARVAFDSGLAWALVHNNGRWTMRGGDVEIIYESTHTLADYEFADPGAFRVLAIRIDLALTPTGEDLTPRVFPPLSEFTVSNVAMALVTKETLEAARSVLPGSRNSGTIYIPVATLYPFQQMTSYGFPVVLFVYHQHFLVA